MKQSPWLHLIKLWVSSHLLSDDSIEQIISTKSMSLLCRSHQQKLHTLHSVQVLLEAKTVSVTTLDETLDHFYGIYVPCSVAVIIKLRTFYSIQALFETKQSSWLCLMKLRVSSSLSRSFLRNLFLCFVAVSIKVSCFVSYTSHPWDETVFMTTFDETLGFLSSAVKWFHWVDHFYGIYFPTPSQSS